jgi:hypothetical protein
MRSCSGLSSRSTTSATRFSVWPRECDWTGKRIVLMQNAVASKCGIDLLAEGFTVTNSAAHIKEYIEGTIERLGSTPDLYYLHRIDPSMYRKPPYCA